MRVKWQPHERVRDDGVISIELPFGRGRRPPERIEVRAVVSGVAVPYAVDAREYRRRIAERDEARDEAAAKLELFRRERGRLRRERRGR